MSRSTSQGDVPSPSTEERGNECAEGPALAYGPPLRILVAEDNELNVELIRELLSQRGHRIQIVNDGRAALALAVQGSFDLLLLDLHMPEMDGFEVAAAIREHEVVSGGHLPILALTARSAPRDRERCLAAGMDSFLPKPIEADDLWSCIDQLAATFPPRQRRDTQLLDAGVIIRACGGRAAVFERLSEVFRRSLPGHLAELSLALRAQDLARLRGAAHKVCGTLGAFSSVAGAVALALEDAAGHGDILSCRSLHERLEVMCAELLEEVARLTFEQLRT